MINTEKPTGVSNFERLNEKRRNEIANQLEEKYKQITTSESEKKLKAYDVNPNSKGGGLKNESNNNLKRHRRLLFYKIFFS
jgi:hypothetical protein